MVVLEFDDDDADATNSLWDRSLYKIKRFCHVYEPTEADHSVSRCRKTCTYHHHDRTWNTVIRFVKTNHNQLTIADRSKPSERAVNKYSSIAAAAGVVRIDVAIKRVPACVFQSCINSSDKPVVNCCHAELTTCVACMIIVQSLRVQSRVANGFPFHQFPR